MVRAFRAVETERTRARCPTPHAARRRDTTARFGGGAPAIVAFSWSMRYYRYDQARAHTHRVHIHVAIIAHATSL